MAQAPLSAGSSQVVSSAHPAWSTQLSPVFPVIVAITADTAATAAIHMTQALAHECGAVPTVVRVVQDDLAAEAAATGVMGGIADIVLDPAYRTTQLTALQRQVHHILGDLPAWRYDIEVGATVPTIVTRARDVGAELVILGLPQHNFFRRAFVRDTIQGVLEETESAVLAVRPELFHRPKSILVAVDFGLSSLRAAHLACQLVAPGGRVILVYVQPDVSEKTPHDTGNDAGHLESDNASAIAGAFTGLIDELQSSKAITIDSVIEHGNSITGVKEAARRLHPDVIALGARHHSAVDWFFGDSVSTELVSDRQWSLLVVPE